MTGAFTPAPKTVRIALIPPGTNDWQSVVSSSTSVVSATQKGTPEGGSPAPAETTWLSFIVPPHLPSGVYGFEIIDPTTAPVFGIANEPAINWVIGVPSQTDPATALQEEVHDCGAEPGENLRIFGKNFSPSNQVILQSSTGDEYPLKISRNDSNSLIAAVPSNLPAGVYNLWVGDSPWDTTSSAASQITLYAQQSYKINSVSCPLIAGTVDNTAALQACLDQNAPAPGAKTITYISVPAGKFTISDTLYPHSYEVLLGISASNTQLVGTSATPPSTWLALPQFFGMANISITAPADPNLVTASNIWNSSPLTEGHYYFSGVHFQDTGEVLNIGEQLFVLSGPDIQVYNSYFLSSQYQAFDIDLGDGAIVAGNTFILNGYVGNGIEDSQNIIFEKNTTTSQHIPVPNQLAGKANAGSGLGISRGNSQWGPSALSRNIYVGYNTFESMGITGQQIITNDGDGGSYLGPITTSTATEVTLANDPSWNWMGTTNPEAAVMAIVSGRGEGQYSFLAGWNGRTIELASPWKVLPDSTSVVVIAQYELNMTYANNKMANTLGSTIVLGDSLESVVEDNIMINSDQGILIAAQGPYGAPAGYGPVINTDVLRNTLSTGAGDLIASAGTAGGLGIADFPGCMLSGLMMRGNTVADVQTMFLTDGWNQINGLISEQNTGIWSPTFPLPGLLIQDNTAPPNSIGN